MRKLMVFLMCAMFAAPVLAHNKSSDVEQLREAEKVVTNIMSAPDKGIPKDLFEKAECVGVFPNVAKGAFVVGGKFGRGVFTCRQSNGELGPPAFFTIGGASFGWQFGGESADLILLVMNKGSIDNLLKDKFTLGAEASAVAGPVGRTAQAATDAQLQAGILSWSRSKGLFLGASLAGTVIKPHTEANESFYGKPISAKDILIENKAAISADARSFLSTANRYAKR